MQKVKKTIKTALAGILLAGAFAVPASAQTNNCTAEQLAANLCVAVDNSTTVDRSVTVGQCSNYNSGDANAGDGDDGGAGVGVGVGVIGSGTGTGTGGNGGNGGNASISQSVDCTTHNHVTNVNQAQVKKSPKGAVHAGAGGASSEVSAASIVGVVGSVVTMGAGLILRRQGFEL